MNTAIRTITVSMLFGVATLLAACSQVVPQKGTKATTPTYALAAISGNFQASVAGTNLPYAFAAKVTDQTGNAANSIQVDWSVTSGGGSLNNIYGTSDRYGQVSAHLAVGTTAGSNTVTATLHGTTQSLTWTSLGTNGVASPAYSSITGVSGVQNDGTSVSAITITLHDSNNNPVSGLVPQFTSSGSGNGISACTTTDANGVSTCGLTSTIAETKTITISSPSITTTSGTVTFVSGSVVSTTISGTTPVTANGSSTSTISIRLMNSAGNGVPNVVPQFAATNTGSGNTYGTCTSTNSTGNSTCTLASTKAEVKTLSVTSPISYTSSNTVTFTAGAASSARSTITGTGPVEPDGSSYSTITITILDANSNAISGTVPTFSATDSGSNNVYGTCSSTNSLGVSTCTLKSQTAEVKTLKITSPVTVTGGTVTFTASAVSAANSTITGTTNVTADGASTSTVTITLKDASNVPVGGTVPTFSATNTGSTNAYGTCTSSSVTTGISTCTFTSRKAEVKTLSLVSPVSVTGGTVTFVAGPVATSTSTATGTGPTVADGVTTSTITVTLLDQYSNPVSGVNPSFTATDTGSTNTYSTCSTSSSSGVSTCTLKSTKAEVKTLTITSPINSTGSTVTFIHGAASISYSSINGTGPVSPDGSSTSTITIVLADAFNNPVNAVVPTFTATDTGSTNSYGTCAATSTSGVSTCTLASQKSETKTLSLVTPISMTGGTVVFAPGAASATTSTITGSGPVSADGSSTSTITITLKDASGVAIPGTVPTFTATNTNNTNVYGTCSATNASGVATCSLASTRAEVKTLAIQSPVYKSGGTVTFTGGTASSATSQISGTGPVVANGTATSTVTILLYDSNNNPVSGITPNFSATDTGGTNVYGACSASSSTGVSTCTLKSTKAETKILSIVSPVSVSSGTVTFTAQAASATTSTITGTSPITADGSSASTITVTLKDVNGNAVAGTVPTFTATNTGTTNTYGTCSTSNTSGVSSCTLKSTVSETKTLTLATPVSVTGGTVVFQAGAASATNSTITGTSPVNADGATTSTITITLKDVNNNALVGTVPTFSATDTGTTNVYGTCSASTSAGVSVCTLKSTKGEVKTLAIVSPVSKTTGTGTVTFTAVAATAYSTITGTTNVTADGSSTSTVTVTLKDYSNTVMVGVTPVFTASGSSNTVGTCGATNASGQASCTLSSTKAETKTLSITSPISLSGGTVTFVAGAASSTNTTITGTGPVNADGTTASTITITLIDANSNAIVGTTPTFSATNTSSGNTYGACSSSSTSGVSTCTLKSTKGEVKTLSLTAPISKTGGTITFTAVPSAANTTMTGTTGVAADGTSASTITITIKDYSNTGMSGYVPTFSATDTNSTNVMSACSTTTASGVSTCTLK